VFVVIDGDDKAGPNPADGKWEVKVPKPDVEAPKNLGKPELTASEGEIVQITTAMINLVDNKKEAHEIAISTPQTTEKGGKWSNRGADSARRAGNLDFTMQDVINGAIFYEAPVIADLVAGAVTFDRITITASDGDNTFVFAFSVTIEANANGAWDLETNAYGSTFRVNEGGCATVTTTDIRLSYPDGTGVSSFSVKTEESTSDEGRLSACTISPRAPRRSSRASSKRSTALSFCVAMSLACCSALAKTSFSFVCASRSLAPFSCTFICATSTRFRRSFK